MGLRLNTNMASLTTRRILEETSSEQEKRYQRLASGERIVSSGDDPAGLSIASGLKAQIRSMLQAERNANDAVSLIQVVEGGMNEVGNILIRLRELAVQSASDTAVSYTHLTLPTSG